MNEFKYFAFIGKAYIYLKYPTNRLVFLFFSIIVFFNQMEMKENIWCFFSYLSILFMSLKNIFFSPFQPNASLRDFQTLFKSVKTSQRSFSALEWKKRSARDESHKKSSFYFFKGTNYFLYDFFFVVAEVFFI